MQQRLVSFSIEDFCSLPKDEVRGRLAEQHAKNHINLASLQTGAWDKEYDDLHKVLQGKKGRIIFEYSIPGLPRTIDVVLLIKGVVFVLEYKSGYTDYYPQDVRQTNGYALRLKFYHNRSHDNWIVPILIATDAPVVQEQLTPSEEDRVYRVIKCNSNNLLKTINEVLSSIQYDGDRKWEDKWEEGVYKSSPTTIAAARNVWRSNSVFGFSQGEADSSTRLEAQDYIINNVIEGTKKRNNGHGKSIVFITGVPGAGKTLVGLNLSVALQDEGASMLSGNDPLVEVLSCALNKDLNKPDKNMRNDRNEISIDSIIRGAYGYKKEIFDKRLYYRNGVVSFKEGAEPSTQHVIIFDEAQRAWDQAKMVSHGLHGKKDWQEKAFPFSEPGLLLWDMNQCDWGVFICLVGGGQEINRGEAGICEWLRTLSETEDLKDWHIYMSDEFRGEIYDSKDESGRTIDYYRNLFARQNRLHIDNSLYLSTSQRSLRTDKVSLFVEELLNCNIDNASRLYADICHKYHIYLTRDLDTAKAKLRERKEMLIDKGYVDGINDEDIRIGMLMSSKAARMRPLGYEIKKKNDYLDYVGNWFLDPSESTISSNFLEVALNEFFVQGLELDFATVMWDADLRYNPETNNWNYFVFYQNRSWNPREEDTYTQNMLRMYMKNAYRVLLTRARIGMVIYVPTGSDEDKTRVPEIYNDTFEYLKSIGLELI